MVSPIKFPRFFNSAHAMQRDSIFIVLPKFKTCRTAEVVRVITSFLYAVSTSGLWHYVAWYKLIEESDESAVSIFRVDDFRLRQQLPWERR
jgi:hypothetical protein